MTTVSILIDDIHAGVETLRRAIGIPEPRPRSYRSGPGIDAVFCRVHPKYAVAPTFLELVAPGTIEGLPGGAPVFPAREVSEHQGDRAIKWHATELAMTDEQMAELADHLEGIGVAVGYHPPDARDRFYLGGHPASRTYDPTADAGLFIEATKSGHLGLPDDTFQAPADIPPGVQPETMVRMVAREYLVKNLDTTLAALDRNLRWTPSSVANEDGHRRAVMPFSTPRSTRLELVEPTGPGRVGDAYEQLGPGAWTIRIAVVDVDAKAKDLNERGTPHTLDHGVLRPDPASTLQVPFEFITA
ncbi:MULTISPECIES: hypothetical protein [unclassified Pseudofrankia]|uniref:hypothetical protein n=1 Tax=unclassified Pseudofrankia TaxID=2994372 RepID=UPI0010426673|nr:MULTISPECIES: hypothetical protein [unclassified Pseudofrankia]MDT3440589.1 hypothetical protein [Pseudofrankia sp. BMG5.37]